MNISEDPKPAIKEALKRANESAQDIEAVLDHIENLERANEQQQLTIERQLKRTQELDRINKSHLTRIKSQEEFMEKRLDAIDRLQKENICLLEKLKGKEQKVKELKTRIQQGVPYNENYFDFVAEVCELIRHKPLGLSFDRVVKDKAIAALKAVLAAKTITKNVLQEVEFCPFGTVIPAKRQDSDSYSPAAKNEIRHLKDLAETSQKSADRLREVVEERNAAISRLEVEIGVANGNLDFNRRLAALQKFLLKCIKPYIPEETYKHYYELAKQEYPLLPSYAGD